MHCAIRREVQCKWGQKQLHSDFSRCGQALPMLGNCKLHQLVSGTEQGWQSLHPVQTAFWWTKPKCSGPLPPMIYNTTGVKIKTPHSPPSVFSQLPPSTCWRAIKPNLHLYTSANIHIKKTTLCSVCWKQLRTLKQHKLSSVQYCVLWLQPALESYFHARTHTSRTHALVLYTAEMSVIYRLAPINC